MKILFNKIYEATHQKSPQKLVINHTKHILFHSPRLHVIGYKNAAG